MISQKGCQPNFFQPFVLWEKTSELQIILGVSVEIPLYNAFSTTFVQLGLWKPVKRRPMFIEMNP
jgi:hypothetical protein